jgi:ankyrin repeat protein
VRELLSHGANANAVSSYGYTALIFSSFNGHVEVVRVLLAAGASKHIVAAIGGTATSIAQYGPTMGSRAAILALLAAAP